MIPIPLVLMLRVCSLAIRDEINSCTQPFNYSDWKSETRIQQLTNLKYENEIRTGTQSTMLGILQIASYT